MPVVLSGCVPSINTRRGFSLAEVLLALALAAILVLLSVALSLTAMKGNQKGSDLTLAQSLAHQWMAQEIYQAQHNAGAGFWASNSDAAVYSSQELSLGPQRFTLSYYVSDASDTSAPNLKKVRLRLSWWGGELNREGYGKLSTEVVRFVSRP